MSRRCDAIGCEAAVGSGKFLCINHWRMVPIELQRTINDRFRTHRRNFAFLRDPAYLSAAVTAIDRIAAREGKQGMNPYRRHLVLSQRPNVPAAKRRCESPADCPWPVCSCEVENASGADQRSL